MEIIQKNKGLYIAFGILIFANIATLSTLLYISLKDKDLPAFSRPKNGGGGAAFLTQSLSFNTEQLQKFNVLKQDHQSKTRQQREQLRNAKEAFFLLLKDSLATSEKIEIANKKISQFEEQINLITYTHFKQVRALCTNMQQKKFDSLIISLVQQIAMPKPPRPNHRRPDDASIAPNDEPPPPREEGQEPPPRRDGEERPPK